jgi:hypothetical protein
MNTTEDLHELRAMRASWQALARRWELTRGELRALLPSGGEDRPSPPEDTERRMRLMLAISHRLPFRDDADEMRAWPRTPLDAFGGLCPLDLMADGPRGMAPLRRYAEYEYGL